MKLKKLVNLFRLTNYSSLNQLNLIQGPVYNVERAHNFQHLDEVIKQAKKLVGPIYQIDNQHHYNEILEHVDKLVKINNKEIIKILKNSTSTVKNIANYL